MQLFNQSQKNQSVSFKPITQIRNMHNRIHFELKKSDLPQLSCSLFLTYPQLILTRFLPNPQRQGPQSFHAHH